MKKVEVIKTLIVKRVLMSGYSSFFMFKKAV